MSKFERKYAEEFRDKRERYRFDFEFGQKETDFWSIKDIEEFIEAKKFLGTTMDATAIKQLARYGWLIISRPTDANKYLVNALFINELGNRNLGKDAETEIEQKFRARLLKMGGKF